MPSEEIVTVNCGGQQFRAWQHVSISAAIKEAARAFRLEVVAELGAAETFQVFKAGAEVEILFNSDLVLKGYVDRYQPRISHNDAMITISGRSKSADLIDSAAEQPKGRFDEKNLKDIATALAAKHDGVEVTVTADVDLEPVPFYQITPGETAFRAVERLARSQGLSIMGTASGGIEIAAGGKKRHGGGIVEGENMKVGEADHNWSNRHSKYIVKGQRASGSNADNLEIEAVTKDDAVNRYRPTVIVVEEDTDRKRAKKRGEARRNRSAGEALKASVTMQGFRDDDGTVWEPNRLIWMESPFLQIKQDMLIERLTFSQDERNGSLTKIELVDPKAYDANKTSGKGDKPKRGKKGARRGVNKSDKSWNFKNNAAVDTTGGKDRGAA